MAAPPISAFAAATAIAIGADGRRTWEVSDAWGAPVGPNGGYVAAAVLRAMRTLPSTADRPPRTLAVHYLRALGPQTAEIELREEQVGRGMTRLSARVLQNGRTCVIALGAFGGAYPTPDRGSIPMPDAPPPDEVPGPEWVAENFTIFPQLDLRQVFGHRPPGVPGMPARSGGWTTLRDPEPLGYEAIALFTDCWWPSVWAHLPDPPPAPTIDLTIHFRGPPPCDRGRTVLTRFASELTAEGYFEEDGWVWSADGTLLAQSRQLAVITGPR